MPGPDHRPARLRLTRRLCLAGGLATACARPDASPASTAATETTATDSSGAETTATGSGPLTTTAEASSGVTTATTTEGDTATTE